MNTSQRDRFGPLALELGARLCSHSAGSRLHVREAALGPGDRSRITEWSKDHGILDGGREVWIEADAGALSRAAGDSPLAAALWAAQVAGSRPFEPPTLMGILNVTPDSFSDGGEHFEVEAAVRSGLRMIEAGAHWLDVGGESTRPGARPVPLAEELKRVIPVIEALHGAGVPRISIDTRHASVAAAALAAGARMVNDVGAGLDDEEMLAVVRDAGCPWVLMHRQGQPEHMQQAPRYGDAVGEIADFLRRRVAECLEAGIEESALWIDPGIGFGKQLDHNLDLLRRLGELRSLGLPLLVGPSRKSFIGHVTGRERMADWKRDHTEDVPRARIGGTAAAITFCVLGGVDVLRVHDVAVMCEASAIASAIAARPSSPESSQC